LEFEMLVDQRVEDAPAERLGALARFGLEGGDDHGLADLALRNRDVVDGGRYAAHDLPTRRSVEGHQQQGARGDPHAWNDTRARHAIFSFPVSTKTSGRLLVVGTPIGNLEALSPRAGRALAEADAIFCEDTRVTAKLAARFSIPARRVSCPAPREA